MTASGATSLVHNLIIFLTFAVILVTLLLQGLTLPALGRLLGVTSEGTAAEEARARTRMSRAALARLDELADQPWVPRDDARHLRDLDAHRQARVFG